MHILVIILLVALILGALLGGESLGETIRGGIGCMVFIVIGLILLIIGVGFVGSNKNTQNNETVSTKEESVSSNTNSDIIVSNPSSYMSAGGVQYNFSQNENGAVLSSAKKVIYLGKNCDAIVKGSDKTGSWFTSSSGITVMLSSDKQILFPGQTISFGQKESCLNSTGSGGLVE